ncbi:2-oxo-4-hydroxy-4-carboxy-5-ureidoimidazoline decarboxylase [Mycobacteroides salmoniphilum]|uniref:2-oxo-4-hydroxy-4-carboxy-5-ureidoimidazoline decarboxylase n=1 Tax=Mycobacteroides salmoniphilum TaxID=404941 RepID=UPI001066160D|nr:2-oxo-4-hydroxy-4-carboxy-5-ureidoimidazoline decarboxylase [Mycobacteroides salmoniphilum]TDZ76862.1 Uric acid degradation bifunctional protein [Mycobacteroides salmoniphilum]TDZ86565.1 Uric acid degradation bifunctional protein [Mycobacteroides salmoniphilum]
MRRVDWRGIESFNELTDNQAIHWLYECCTSRIWAVRVAAGRPFRDEEALYNRADLILAELTDSDLDEALDGHPRIGERPDNAASRQEQSGVAGADAAVLERLKECNAEYEKRFGYVYLVFANGRPAGELLAILQERLKNDPQNERRVMRMELGKINRSRLVRMLGPAGKHADDFETEGGS